MPVIKINEIDNTTPYLTEEELHVVFVPGNVGADFNSDNEELVLGKSNLFTSLSDFVGMIGSEPKKYTNPGGANPYLVDGEIQDPGYTIAKFLLEKGLPVLYKVPVESGAVIETFSGIVGAIEDAEFYDELEDKNIYDIRFLTIGGYEWISNEVTSEEKIYVVANEFEEGTTYYKEDSSTASGFDVATDLGEEDFEEFKTIEIADATAFETAIENYGKVYTSVDDGATIVQVTSYVSGLTYYVKNPTYFTQEDKLQVPRAISRIKAIAESRKDCVFLADHIWTLGAKMSDTNAILECANSICLDNKGDGEYGAMFSPWVDYSNESKDNGLMLLPASVGYLEAFANSVVSNPNWYAAAGRLRGIVSGKPKFKYTDKMCRTLALQEGDLKKWYQGSSVNAICERRGFNTVVVWGNRTLFNGIQYIKAGEPVYFNDLVARSFLNIRQLCLDLQKALYLQANNYMFEQNTDRMWFNFKSEIVNLLDNMKTGQGIEGYKIIKLPSTKRGQLRALVRIVPIEAVEFFDLTVSLENSTVEVELA